MIKYTGEILFSTSQSGKITNASTNIPKNNISAEFSSIVGRESTGNDAYIIASDVLDGSRTFSNKVDYFIGSVLSDTHGGNFLVSEKIIIEAENLSSVTIVFDTLHNEYATILTVNGEPIRNNSTVLTLPIISGKENVININGWSKENSPVVIYGIYSKVKVKINQDNLLYFKGTVMSRSNKNQVSYGVYSNRGDIKLLDSNKKIYNYIQQNLKENATVKINIINTKNAVMTQQICSYLTDKWSYDVATSELNISLKDDLVLLQNYNFNYLSADDTLFDNTRFTAHDLFNILVAETQRLGWRFTNYESNQSLLNALDNQIFESVYITRTKSVWACWEDLCKLCGLYMYEENGEICFIREEYSQENPEWDSAIPTEIIVHSKDVFDVKSDKIVDNKIQAISYNLHNLITSPEQEITNHISVYPYEVSYVSGGGVNILYTGDDSSKNGEFINKDTYAPEQIYRGTLKFNVNAQGFHINTNFVAKPSKNGWTYPNPTYVKCTINYSYIMNDNIFSNSIVTYIGSKYDDVEHGIPSAVFTSDSLHKTVNVFLDFGIFIKGKTGLLPENSYVTSFDFVVIAEKQSDNMETLEVNKGGAVKNAFKLSTGDYNTSKTFSYKILDNNSNNKVKINSTQNLAESIIYTWRDGREYAEILCKVGDYDDTIGRFIISTLLPGKMVFKTGQLVNPYIGKKNGQETPLGVNFRNNPKTYNIIGIDYIYDGCIWQRLHLLEYVNPMEY